VPLAVALEIALTGDTIDAARAYSLGLVNAVVPPDQVLSAALGLAERIAANGPLGVAATKELVRLAVTNAVRAAERPDRRLTYGPRTPSTSWSSARSPTSCGDGSGYEGTSASSAAATISSASAWRRNPAATAASADSVTAPT
jgi:Enoyl-CoA hydratase/isomerase